jgi:GWxTD domain-containing protein
MLFRHLSSVAVIALLAGQVPAQSGVEAVVQTKRFMQPAGGDQVEVDIAVLGGSVHTAPDAQGLRKARVEAISVVERDGSVVDFRKTQVEGPARADSAYSDFVHQEQFLLPPGEYRLSVELRDLVANDTAHVGYTLPLVVPERSGKASFSDIQFTTTDPVDGKAIPFTGSYYPEDVRALTFHAQLYGMPARVGLDSLFLLTYQLEVFETKEVKGAYKRVQRTKAEPVVDIDGGFGIADLPSGNYLLSIEARDRNGASVARQEQLIQRSNPIAYDPQAAADLGVTFANAFTDADTLSEHLRSMRPVANDLERRIIDDSGKDRDLTTMQRFMYTFWYNRNGADPKGAWERYHQAVVEVNRMFGCRNLRGYESDQGYVYLKYGAPNTIVDRGNETATIPYHIWHYYHAGRYRDKRFVFWQPERSTLCWQLLHSEVPGEMKNPRWADMLHQTDHPMNMVNGAAGNSGNSLSGQEVLDNFNNPR